MEGTSSYGAGLTRYLRAQAVRVVEVGRPDRKSQRSAGQVGSLGRLQRGSGGGLGTGGWCSEGHDGVVESIRCLHLARRSAIKARTRR